MKVLNLEAKNIRGIKNIKIEPKGQNVVVFGPNGTGKSAIVDAIDFLLTGKISRLTGEGTKGLSLKEHGCHVDCRKNLKNTVVVAKVEVDGKEVVMKRSINKPSYLKVEPKKCENLVEPYLGTAALGLHILSRREILRYITAEAGKRAKEIMSLLNLTDIENIRATLVTVKNEAKEDFKRLQSSLEIAKSEVSRLLSLDRFSEEASLNKVNELREVLHGSKITQLSPEKIKENLAPRPFWTIEGALTREQIWNTIKELRSLLQSKDDIAEKELGLRTLLEEVEKEAKFKQYLLYERLFEAGISLVDSTNVCPLCGRKWEVGDFKVYLEEKKKETEVAKGKQAKIDEMSTSIKVNLDLLETNIADCMKAHKQFNLKVVDEKELKDCLLALERWLEVMIKPLDSFEANEWPPSSLQEILGSPFLEIKMLAPLEKALKEVGELLSKQQLAWDTLTKMEDHWKRYQQTLEEKETGKILKNRAEKTLDHFEKSRDFVLEKIYDAVQGKFEEYYKIIHSEDETKFKSKISQVGPELNFEVDFYQRGMFPPHALNSEGHQDSMGLCLFFALNNYLVKDAIKVIVLDDVIMSIDCTHRRAICQLLKKAFPDKQYIITTHDNAWAKQLKTEGVITTHKNMMHFVNWNIDTGPIFEMEKDFWDRVQEDLDKNDIPAAAHRLRRNAECFFENVCDFLIAKIPYKGHHQWELGDFAPAAISAYKRYLRRAKANFKKMHQLDKFEELDELEKKSTDIIGKSQIEQWIVNANVHYNRWEEFNKNDFGPVVKAFKDLFGLFVCNSCGRMISKSEAKGEVSKDIVSCDCGKVFWNIQ